MSAAIRVTGISQLKALERRILDSEVRNRALADRFSVMLTQALGYELKAALAEKMDHFSVEMQPGGLANIISVSTTDEVGQYIYHGTGPHAISSDDAMPIGNNQFARRVQHPGTPSHEDEIDGAIRAAYIETKVVLGDGFAPNI
jgi:hypothetical protein